MPKKIDRVPSAREMTVAGIHKGKSNADIVAAIRKAHPRSTITAATVNYVRNQIRQGDKSVKSDRAVRKGR